MTGGGSDRGPGARPAPRDRPEEPGPERPQAGAGDGPGDRCFVAVGAPPALIERLRSLERPARPGLRWTPEGQWHVTLKFFPAVDGRALVDALEAWASAPPGFPAAEAVAGPGPRSLSRRVWMVPVEGLGELAAAVEAATARLAAADADADADADVGADGEGNGAGGPSRPGARPFLGHLTLARARHPAALRHLDQPDLTVRWRVPELVAVHSELTREGARHRVLGRWPLPA